MGTRFKTDLVLGSVQEAHGLFAHIPAYYDRGLRHYGSGGETPRARETVGNSSVHEETVRLSEGQR